MEPSVIAVFGPTASGKSGVASELAARVDGVLIGADAMQVYRGVPVLTNQATEHTELVAIWPLDHEASVGDYAPLAHAAIDRAIAAGRPAVVVGGTGLYFRAALAELDIPPAAPPGTRKRLEALYDEDSGRTAHELLTERDPAAAAGVHANDRRRVVRALELVELGRSLRPPVPRLWTETVRQPTLIVGLERDRGALEARIVTRTRSMLERGAREEAQAALSGPISVTASRIIGLREAAELPAAAAAAAISLRTRRYAAYQRKWMRRIPSIHLVDGDRGPANVADEILEVARAR